VVNPKGTRGRPEGEGYSKKKTKNKEIQIKHWFRRNDGVYSSDSK